MKHLYLQHEIEHLDLQHEIEHLDLQHEIEHLDPQHEIEHLHLQHETEHLGLQHETEHLDCLSFTVPLMLVLVFLSIFNYCWCPHTMTKYNGYTSTTITLNSMRKKYP